jgi:hypothetical protein
MVEGNVPKKRTTDWGTCVGYAGSGAMSPSWGLACVEGEGVCVLGDAERVGLAALSFDV